MSESTLLSIALLGTSRDQAFPPCPHESLAGPWQELDSSRILMAAALESAAFSTGITPTKGNALEPAQPDDRPPLPQQVTDPLAVILKETQTESLAELLSHALRAGFRAPHQILPALLDFGKRHHPFRSQITQLVGPRGAWLARQAKGWEWVKAPSSISSDSWEIGEDGERLHWLRQTRKDSPPASSQAILSSWKSEDPAFRLEILKTLEGSITTDDEPWLTLALADPRREIRYSATSLLLGIRSQFRERSLERARSLVTVKGSKLTVTPPAEFDPGWKADGIRQKPPAKTGERAWWLRQLLARVPLTDWPELIGTSAHKFFSVKIGSDWKDIIHWAWLDSAKLLPSPDFLPGLIKISPQSTSELLATLPTEDAYPILDSLPPALALAQLNRLATPPTRDHSCLNLILPHFLKGQATSRPEARRFAFCIPSHQIAGTLERISQQESIDSMTEEFARTLEFRQSYLNPLTS